VAACEEDAIGDDDTEVDIIVEDVIALELSAPELIKRPPTTPPLFDGFPIAPFI